MMQTSARLNPALGAPADAEATTSAGAGKWLALLCLTLLGYALCGKGFAYIFIGEVLLFWGLVWLVGSGQWRRLTDVGPFWLLLLLGGWVLTRTWPELPRYGIEALRDTAIWGYSLFALVVYAYLLARPERLTALLRWYRVFIVLFLLGVPAAWFAYRYYIFPERFPYWPWADVPVILPKGGDIQVHLAGILAFWVMGYAGVVGLWRVLLFAFSLIVVGTYDRAGLLSFLAVFAVCFVAKPCDRSLWRLMAVGACGILVLAVADIRVKMLAREREISFEQVLANLASLTGTSTTGDLDDTKIWRLEWWSDILDYTVYGEYFWTGKGFGINLADDDGYQVEADKSLRSPHNGHLTMLARAGVPGFILWVLVQVSWWWVMARGYLRSRQAGHERWAGLFLFLLAYGVAFMINTTFDVFIEGPMGGVWYWTVYGTGLAALRVYRHAPELLSEGQAKEEQANAECRTQDAECRLGAGS
jgi:O-antigen ligase